jgi:protein arginine N-methyltransferase 2
VLNVGFGMGIVDAAIQRRSPRTHTIVEAHPGVHARMLADGWGERPGVRVVLGRWQDVVAEVRA